MSKTKGKGGGKPSTAKDGPVQTRDTKDEDDAKRQIAQERQQSTGQGWGQS